jgi:hypothetical protein
LTGDGLKKLLISIAILRPSFSAAMSFSAPHIDVD